MMKKSVLILFVSLSFFAKAQKIPTGVESDTYQRELKLVWDNDGDPDVRWEVVVDGNTPIITKTNECVVAGLEPNTRYDIKVRAFKGSVYSNYATVSNAWNKTSTIYKAKDDLQRVPHLRTLTGKRNLYGQVYSRELDLFYNDLWNGDAEITYYIDSVEVAPNGHTLTFPKSGKQVLKIIIKETPKHIWELEYNLDIRY